MTLTLLQEVYYFRALGPALHKLLQLICNAVLFMDLHKNERFIKLSYKSKMRLLSATNI
jgi:hypothetical protein